MSAVEPIYRNVAAWMRRERKRCGLTQDDLAIATGLSRPSIVNMELGRQRIALHTLITLADLFDNQPSHSLAIADGFRALANLRNLP